MKIIVLITLSALGVIAIRFLVNEGMSLNIAVISAWTIGYWVGLLMNEN